jgi:hypothetical protein
MLSPALVAQALDETAASITRIVLTFVGAALFCLLRALSATAPGDDRLHLEGGGFPRLGHDREAAINLLGQFERAGLKVFRDQERLREGDLWLSR